MIYHLSIREENDDHIPLGVTAEMMTVKDAQEIACSYNAKLWLLDSNWTYRATVTRGGKVIWHDA